MINPSSVGNSIPFLGWSQVDDSIRPRHGFTPLFSVGVLVWSDVLLAGLKKAGLFCPNLFCWAFDVAVVFLSIISICPNNCPQFRVFMVYQLSSEVWNFHFFGGREILRSGSDKSFSMSFKIWKIIAHLRFFVQFSTKTDEDLLCCTWTGTTCEISGQDCPRHLAFKEIQISNFILVNGDSGIPCNNCLCLKIWLKYNLGGNLILLYYPTTGPWKGFCLDQFCSIFPTYMEIKNLTTPRIWKTETKKTKHTLKTTNISSSHIVDLSRLFWANAHFFNSSPFNIWN